MSQRKAWPRARRERGAVLIVSLMLLLVMTLLGLGASQSTRLQERMAGNQRDLELAMQGAEATMRGAEHDIGVVQTADDRKCQIKNDECAPNIGLIKGAGGIPLDLAKQLDEWWDENAELYERSEDLVLLSDDPEFVIEYYAEVPETIGPGGSKPNIVRDLFRTTNRSRGLTESAEVIVQGTYSRVAYQ